MRTANAAIAAWEALRTRPLATLLVASAALKLAYVFFLTQYSAYLFSDFAGYWLRAHQRMAGDDLLYGQWAFWPPAAHILLAWYLKLVWALGLTARELEAALVLNVAASTASVALLYGIALETLKSRAWALGVAALYAFTFPLVYFNAFVMSEHGATLLMLAAAYLVLRYRGRGWVVLAAGAALGVATAMRPGLGVMGLPVVLYLALADGGLSRAKIVRAGAFSCGFFVVVAGAVAEMHRISSGQVNGLSANGPLSFYVAQCRTATVHINYREQRSWFTGPSNANRPENGVVYLDLADYSQRPFSELGWRCLREEPDRLRVIAQRASDLFFGPLLPSVSSAAGFNALLPPFRWFFLAAALLLPLGFAVRREHGVSTAALGLVGGLLAASLPVLAVYSVEHRYLYPLLPFIYVVDAAVLLAARRDARRFREAGGALVAGLAVLGIAALALELARRSGPPPIHTEVREHAPSIETPSVYDASSWRLYSPTGQPLVMRVGDEVLRAVHSTCMDVRVAGEYEFQVVPTAGFMLSVDGRQLLDQPQARSGEIYRWRVQLAPGKHRYVLRVSQPIGATATWRHVASRFNEFAPALGMRYVGEPGEEAVFLPPYRC